MNNERDTFPQFQSPEIADEIILPEVYRKSLPQKVKDQFIDSWGEEGKGWRIKAVAGAAIILVVTVAGEEYFRLREEKKDKEDD